MQFAPTCSCKNIFAFFSKNLRNFRLRAILQSKKGCFCMKIALLGCGVVGGGVLDICNKRSDTELEYVLVRRPRPELGDKAVSDIDTILNDASVDTVVEVMGGLHPAYEYVTQAMKSGKNVVTANKHLVAHRKHRWRPSCP